MRMRRHAPKVQRTKAKRNKQHQRERACTDVTIRGPSIFGGVGCAQSMDPAPLEGLTVLNPWTQHLWRGWLCTICGPSIFGGVGCAQSVDLASLEGLTVHNPWTQHLWRGWLCTICGPSIFGGVDCAPRSQLRHKARLLICDRIWEKEALCAKC